MPDGNRVRVQLGQCASTRGQMRGATSLYLHYEFVFKQQSTPIAFVFLVDFSLF